MSLNGCRVEWFDPQAEVVHVATRARRGAAASAAEHAIYRNEVDERAASAKLSQSDLCLLAFYLATQHVAIEPQHSVQIDNSEHDVIDLSYVDHDMNLESDS
jgi:hypothetical protein